VNAKLTELARPGRPPKQKIESLRYKTWYWWLRARSTEDLSDASLGERIGFGAASRAVDRMRRTGMVPKAIFQPESDTFQEGRGVLAVCEASENYAGSLDLLTSEFWACLGKKTNTLKAVREKIDEMLVNGQLLRLDQRSRINVDGQIRQFIQQSGKSDPFVSSARIYTQFLWRALQGLNNPFDRLALVGLLLREALLLGAVDQTYLLSKVFESFCYQVIPKGKLGLGYSVWDEIDDVPPRTLREKNYRAFRKEFMQTTREYAYSGHVDMSEMASLYPEGSSAVEAYILNSDSGFLENSDRAYAEWQAYLPIGSEGVEVDALIGIGMKSQWNFSD